MIGYEGASRYARLIQALTGDTEIVPPGLTLEADRLEYGVLKNEQAWCYTYKQGGGDATHWPIVGIWCSQANAISVVQGIMIGSQNNNYSQYKLNTRPKGTHDTEHGVGMRDTRRVSPITKMFKTLAGADPLSGTDYFDLPTGTPFVLPVPWVLTTDYELILTLVNSGAGIDTATMMAWGIERTLRPEEVTQ